MASGNKDLREGTGKKVSINKMLISLLEENRKKNCEDCKKKEVKRAYLLKGYPKEVYEEIRGGGGAMGKVGKILIRKKDPRVVGARGYIF